MPCVAIFLSRRTVLGTALAALFLEPTDSHARNKKKKKKKKGEEPVADRNCTDFATQAEAQTFFLSQGGPARDPHSLDTDYDGIACENLPCPCSP
jgi:hypothetical protein